MLMQLYFLVLDLPLKYSMAMLDDAIEWIAREHGVDYYGPGHSKECLLNIQHLANWHLQTPGCPTS